MLSIFVQIIFATFVFGQELKLCSEQTKDPVPCKTGSFYKNNISPKPWPARIKPDIYIKDILEIHGEDQTLTIFVDIIIHWQDSRISFSADNGQPENGTWLQIADKDHSILWRPDVQFLNVIDIQKLPSFSGTITNSFWLSAPHTLEFSETVKVTISCELDYTKFPFDDHDCDFDFGDGIYENDVLVFEAPRAFYRDKMAEVDADGKSMIVVNRPRLPFEILIHVKPPFDYKFPATDEVYSYVGLKLKMKRKDLDQLLAGYFVPTGIFALLSVLSFFVPPEQVPGRMGLLVTLYLITANTYGSIKAPSMRGFSYTEVWMCAVQVPILLALTEYGYILSCLKYKDDQKTTAWQEKSKDSKKDCYNRLDKVFAGLSLLFFIVFNGLFWGLSYAM